MNFKDFKKDVDKDLLWIINAKTLSILEQRWDSLD